MQSDQIISNGGDVKNHIRWCSFVIQKEAHRALHQCCMQCAFQQMWQIIQIYGYMVFLYIWHTAEIIGLVSECHFW